MPPGDRANLLTQLEWADTYLSAALAIESADASTKVQLARLRRELDGVYRSARGLRIL